MYQMLEWFYNLLHQQVEVDEIEDETQSQNYIPIVWLHGAGQTHRSWEYIREHINHPHEIVIDYSQMNRFYENLEEMKHKIGNDPVFVVGHSLGGLYGLHLTQHCNVVGGVSVSTPFRGSSAADWAKYVIPSYPLFKDVGRRSAPVVEAAKIKLNIPWTQLVSTAGGVPYLKDENDGVCTVASMTSRNDMEIIRVDSTHYEVMCDANVVDAIARKYNEVNTLVQVNAIKK